MDFTKFAGIAPSKIREDLNIFDELLNGGEVILETKKVYQHREEGLNFDYKYMVNISDFSEFLENIPELSEDYPYIAELLLVPCPKSLKREVQESVVTCVCGKTEYLKEEIKNLGCRDVMEYGASVVMGTALGFSAEEIPRVVNLISNVVDAVDGLLGYYMDRPQNKAGETGWNRIEEWVR